MESTKNKKVLMLCYYFPPYMEVGSLRSRKYALYLPQHGWGCEVVTAYRGKDVSSMFPESVHIHPTWTFSFEKIVSAAVKLLSPMRSLIQKTGFIFGADKNKRQDHIKKYSPTGGLGIANKFLQFFLLPDSQFLWILLALPKALWVSRSCNVIYSSSSPVSAHVLGLIIHKMTHKPWVVDYRDAWTLNSQWFPPSRFHRWLGERLEKACVKNARYIVNVTEPLTQAFKRKYFEYADQCLTIPNGYDEADVADFRGRKLAEDYILMTSIGSLYGGRDPSQLLVALKELIDEGYVHRGILRFLFINASDPQLNVLIKHLNLSDVVKTIPWMPQAESFKYLAESHVALLVGSDMAKLSMTTKVYEYAGMGKLIFALVPDGPVKDFVEKFSGVVADPKDKTQIKAALRIIVANNHNRSKANLNIPSIASHYERRALAFQMSELLNKATVKGSSKNWLKSVTHHGAQLI
jgi:glycosyltransferase involved in cell wall biosynthesis